MIFKTIDVHGQFADQDLKWENDPNLEQELMAKLAPGRGVSSSDDAELSPLGELVGRISDELLESGRLSVVPSELLVSLDDLPATVRSRIEQALLGALSQGNSGGDSKPSKVDPNLRVDQMIQLFKTYTRRINRDDIADFTRRYARPLSALSQESFEGILSAVGSAIRETKTFDQRLTVHKGHKFVTLLEVLDELLTKHGATAADNTGNTLFGEEN